jgi:photosystem II stability/assembly factor-like uncharacterized protein
VGRQEGASFLKKRSKKLLILESDATATRDSREKRFLVLFFKKEHAFFLCVCAAFMLMGTAMAAAPDTDTPIWRATHGVLLSVARAGRRLVAVGDRGTVLLSDDDGLTWKEAASGTGELLTDVIFPNATEGWAVGQDSTILHSSDGGQHWSVQLTKPAGDQSLFSIASLGPHHLIATGAYALVLETQDGQTWSPVKLPAMDEDYHLNCVQARGADVVISGEAGHGFVRHDGAWSAMPVPYDGSQFGCLAAAHGSADGAIYSFGLRGSLFVSTPQAPTWKRIETGVQNAIFGGTVLGDGKFVLVGSGGLLLLFDPQHTTCRVLPPPTAATLSGIVETQSGAWVAVGEDGVHLIDTPREMTQ